MLLGFERKQPRKRKSQVPPYRVSQLDSKLKGKQNTEGVGMGTGSASACPGQVQRDTSPWTGSCILF